MRCMLYLFFFFLLGKRKRWDGDWNGQKGWKDFGVRCVCVCVWIEFSGVLTSSYAASLYGDVILCVGETVQIWCRIGAGAGEVSHGTGRVAGAGAGSGAGSGTGSGAGGDPWGEEEEEEKKIVLSL